MAEHEHELSGTALKQAFLLTACILVIEVAAGFASHSLALAPRLPNAWIHAIKPKASLESRLAPNFQRTYHSPAPKDRAVVIRPDRF